MMYISFGYKTFESKVKLMEIVANVTIKFA
jgi:hypothetical protein